MENQDIKSLEMNFHKMDFIIIRMENNGEHTG